MLRMKKGKMTHRHLYYTVFFNNVCLEEKNHVCVLEDQKATYFEQLNTKAKSLPDKYKFLLHYGPDCCIYCTHTTGLKNSGEAKATCSFITHDYSQQEMLHGSTNKIYVQQRDIDEVFDRHFVSHGTMNNMCRELNVRVLEIMQTSPVQEAAKAIQNAIQLKLHAVKKMELNYELPYSDWLFDLVSEKLCDVGFAVFTRDKDCPKAPAPVNEYIYCKSDLLLYHEQHVECNIQAAHVLLSQLSIEDESNSGINECQLKGGVTELKVDKLDASAENETFYNMFGEAAKLTSRVLCKGKRVQLVTIYGILVSAHKHHQARLLKLKVDFIAGVCLFERCRKHAPFFVLLNEVISLLEHPQ